MTIEEFNDKFDEVLSIVGELKDNCCSDLKYYSDRNLEILTDYNKLVDKQCYFNLFYFISMFIGVVIGVLVSNCF